MSGYYEKVRKKQIYLIEPRMECMREYIPVSRIVKRERKPIKKLSQSISLFPRFSHRVGYFPKIPPNTPKLLVPCEKYGILPMVADIIPPFCLACMFQKIFPNIDISALSIEEIAGLDRFLVGDIPEEELLALATLHGKASLEGQFQTFLNRRCSEAILMAEKNEQESRVMDFLLEF